MQSRAVIDSFRLLRIPFSFYLLPIYLFAISQTIDLNISSAIWIGLILHLLVYPASNGYNSYIDRDTDSIGGFENPPLPPPFLFSLTLAMDISALGIGFWFEPLFALLISVYILISRLYSHPYIRLKRYPWISFFSVSIFQGFWIFMTVSLCVSSLSLQEFLTQPILIAAVATSFMIGGSYPLTQIFQHKADAQNRVITLSMKLGYHNTFYFSMLMFTVAISLLLLYFTFVNLIYFALLLMFLLPVLIWFGLWFYKVRSNLVEANFQNTMQMNTISSLCLNAYFSLINFF